MSAPASGGAPRTHLVVSRENLHDEPLLRRALDGLSGSLAGRARLLDGLGAVSAIGAGITAQYGAVRTGLGLLRDIGVVPAALATSSFRITWLIPRERVDDAVRALHQGLVEAPRLPCHRPSG